jgi:hypothetical protein
MDFEETEDRNDSGGEDQQELIPPTDYERVLRRQ